MLFISLVSEYKPFKGIREVEIYEETTNTRQVYTFNFPTGRGQVKLVKITTVGLKDGYYHEGKYEETDGKLFKALSDKAKKQEIRESTTRYIGATAFHTTYYKQP